VHAARARTLQRRWRAMTTPSWLLRPTGWMVSTRRENSSPWTQIFDCTTEVAPHLVRVGLQRRTLRTRRLRRSTRSARVAALHRGCGL
jgi:hypothetical protein